MEDKPKHQKFHLRDQAINIQHLYDTPRKCNFAFASFEAKHKK